MQLTNTLSKTKEIFVPHNSSRVTMYVCGPTVYDRAHVGNARSAVVFDMVYRLLRHTYGSAHVMYARNFTDIDDKIMLRAAEQGETIAALTQRTIDWYLQDMGSLGVLRPTHEPRATESIDNMISMIQNLLIRGAAYIAEGHVLFDVTAHAAYGKLSNRRLEDQRQGADHPELGSIKLHAGDFVLWKPSTDSQPGWASPWGRGRPGWHIECSAMSQAVLGDQIDIHGGGDDLKFPHHENEIAQSECAHGHAPFSRYWMHNAMVTVGSAKMSKSVGNVVTVNELLEAGYSGAAIRYFLLGTHYRKPLDLTLERLTAAETELRRWQSAVTGVAANAVDAVLLSHLHNDVNVPGAVGVMRQQYKQKDWRSLRASMDLLGL